MTMIVLGYFENWAEFKTATPTFALSKAVRASICSHLEWYFMIGKRIRRVTPCGYA
jgi:hypothetical protein